MRTRNTAARKTRHFNSLIFVGVFAILAVVLAVPFYGGRASTNPAGRAGQPKAGLRTTSSFAPLSLSHGSPLAVETIGTFASDCVTPRTTFVLGEQVCAVVDGVTATDRFVNWLAPPDSTVAFSSPTIPSSATHSYLYTPTVTGVWKATIADPSDSSINSTDFEVVASGPIMTRAAGCLVPQVTFNLGTDVCVHVTGGLVAPRRIAVSDPSGNIRQVTPISADPQDDTFSIPGTPTSTLSNGVEVTNVGTWRASIISSRGSLVDYTTFFVKDPGNATAQLSIEKNSQLTSGQVSAGSSNTYTVVVVNSGPDEAQNVVVTDVVPANTNFVSITPSAGCVTPAPGGTGTITCTIGSVPRGVTVAFDISLEVNAGTASGTTISNTATVASTTSDTNSDNNSSTSSIMVTDTGTAGCTLTCPADMTVTANTTFEGNPGAYVDFSAGTGVGNCGAITNSPSAKDPITGENNFFAVGTHLITSTSGTLDTCTFTVTVVDTPPPTITCQPNQTVTAAPSATSAVVTIVNPTTNPSSGVTLVGIRSDDPNCTDTEIDPGCTPVPVTDPYPLGTTTIVWTVIQPNGQRASCVQSITVNENTCGGDTTPPVITAPANVTFGTGPDPTISKFCTVGLDDELGLPTVTDACSYNISVTGIPPGNAFPVGTTTVTYTATDGAGNSASATQQVTVFDNTPPIIVAPPNASYTCLSEVPQGAAAIAQARGDDPNLPNGGPPTDNCGVVVTYSDSSTGAGSAASPRIITRTFTATDAAANSSSAVQTITVIDPTPPTISCQADIIADYDPAVNGATVTYTPPVGTDNCAGSITALTAGLASGSTFPLGTTTNTFTVTDTGGNTASCSFKVTVALTSGIGLDSVTISGSGYTDSYSSSGGYPATKGSLANILSNGTITMGNSGKVWGNVRSTRVGVNMSGFSQVTGDATAGTTVSLSGSATVLGTITNNALAPVMTLPAVPACGPPYSSTSGITGAYSYNAATGDLTLSGVNIATLADGNYCFHNVTLGNSAQLQVNGPVVIKLTGTLNTSGSTKINSATAIPSNLWILSSYSGSNGIILGNSAKVYALVYAPNTGVNISGSAPLFGTAAGKTITIGNSGAIHLDSQLKTIWPAVWTLIFGP